MHQSQYMNLIQLHYPHFISPTVAKEQGYRSRAAFKLTQINRKFHFLESAKVIIDLCAAPGGWTQVASRTMTKQSHSSASNILLAVDILPIRNIPNVITLIGDITTEKCKAQIKAQLQTLNADVVLCDGAPNVGASYDRDAYQQNEIALHALKCATQHLKRNGTFVTKMYRSSDYSSFVWIVKQLFDQVQAVKPTASRSQSAEIFLVCTGYLDPTSIDPRMLDPKSVFEQVDGAATGGGDGAQKGLGSKGVTIFSKQFDKKKKSRQGYDMDVLDFAMRNIGNVADFVESSSTGIVSDGGVGAEGGRGRDPVQMLSFCTGLSFACHLCKAKEEHKRKGEDVHVPDCNCDFYLNHRLTTSEIKVCIADLKVLNKSDFKGLLTWREKMQVAIKAQLADPDDDDEDGTRATAKIALANGADEEMDSDAEERGIQAEIEKLRMKKGREQKKVKRKERELQAKRRKRSALGMDLNAIELPEQERMFSLATISSAKDLEKAREIDLGMVTDEQLFENEEEEVDDEVARNKDGEVVAQGEEDDIDEDTGYNYRLDRELDSAYDQYLANTKNKGAKTGTKSAKRSKRAMRLKASEQALEDDDMMVDNDTKVYAEMLQGPKESDDDSSDDDEEQGASSDDDGFNSAPVTPSEHKKKVTAKKEQKEVQDVNPLIHRLAEDSSSIKTARWFSNPLFENIGTAASFATMTGPKGVAAAVDADDYDDDNSDNDVVVQELSDDEDKPKAKRAKRNNQRKEEKNIDSDDDSEDGPITANSVLAMMPKTDKQIRHEKRLKSTERKGRRDTRRARIAGEVEGGFEVVEGEDDAEDMAKDKLESLSEKDRKQVLEARALIKAGLGAGSRDKESDGFEVVSAKDTKTAAGLLPILDQREYNSDNEAYDSDDYAETLALGTMMLRQSKAKSLVDASYNRFAWNDPEDLPDWFQDDETKNYRPQLPIPPELMAKMKAKFMSLATRPITKVAEARARKNKRARGKLVAAKKKAETVANSSEMSEAMKLKAISKAMRGNDSSRPSKSYVVSRRGGGTSGGKGIKLVDSRMKNDKRGMERATKKKKEGKKGGLTGGKRRRSHS
jgi:AdoMet-dependent rRNA methyltransferase SPB1